MASGHYYIFEGPNFRQAISHGWGRHGANLSAEQLEICLIVRSSCYLFHGGSCTFMTADYVEAALYFPVNIQNLRRSEQSIHPPLVPTNHAAASLP
jgi:hypothetical protein